MIKPLKKLIEFWKIEDEGWGRISLLGFIFYLMFVHYCYYEGINIFFIEDLLDSLVFNIKYHFDSKK